MSKVYSKTYGNLSFFLGLIVMACIFAPIALKDKMYVPFMGFIIFGIVTLFLLPAIITEKYIVTDSAIIKSHGFPTRSYEIKFNEISMIVDDNVSTIGMKLHVFHLIPKAGIKKNFKRFTIHEGIKNRKDLLSEILSRIGPDVNVEDAVYQYLGKGSSKTVTK